MNFESGLVMKLMFCNSFSLKKIFMQIEKERNENEFNRTQIQNRRDMLQDVVKDLEFDINQTGDLRLLDNCDPSSRNNSYLKSQMSSHRN